MKLPIWAGLRVITQIELMPVLNCVLFSKLTMVVLSGVKRSVGVAPEVNVKKCISIL